MEEHKKSLESQLRGALDAADRALLNTGAGGTPAGAHVVRREEVSPGRRETGLRDAVRESHEKAKNKNYLGKRAVGRRRESVAECAALFCACEQQESVVATGHSDRNMNLYFCISRRGRRTSVTAGRGAAETP